MDLKRIAKFSAIGFGALVLLFILIAVFAGEGEKAAMQQQPVIAYNVLRSWNPDDDSSALGIEILVSPSDVSEENIVNLVQRIAGDKSKAVIKIYQDKEVWQGEREGVYGEAYDEGYLAFYVKNTTRSGAYRGFNEIRWFQKSGKLEGFFGTSTQL